MTTSPPLEIQVGPHAYRVEVVPDGILEGAGADGTCHNRRLTLAVDGGQPPTQMADCLLHELTHALLATIKLEDDAEEALCLILGPALLDLVRDNPKLIDWIQSL